MKVGDFPSQPTEACCPGRNGFRAIQKQQHQQNILGMDIPPSCMMNKVRYASRTIFKAFRVEQPPKRYAMHTRFRNIHKTALRKHRLFPKNPRKSVGSIATSHKSFSIPLLIILLYWAFRLKIPKFLLLIGKMPTEPEADSPSPKGLMNIFSRPFAI